MPDRTGTNQSPGERSRHPLLMLMLAVQADGTIGQGLSGLTRLQKFLFLLEHEEGIAPAAAGFEFIPYKAGPYSRKVYDDIELLENLGLIESTSNGEATEAEAAEIADLSFGHLMGDDAASFSSESEFRARTADTLEERRFSLTARGREYVESLIRSGDFEKAVAGIRKVKSRFSNHSLQDLLYYVYTKYEDEGWTTESEIRDQVLSRGRRSR